eukprot:scaffold73621_cov26-Tisochrysis_lutea.AAC.1
MRCTACTNTEVCRFVKPWSLDAECGDHTTIRRCCPLLCVVSCPHAGAAADSALLNAPKGNPLPMCMRTCLQVLVQGMQAFQLTSFTYPRPTHVWTCLHLLMQAS